MRPLRQFAVLLASTVVLASCGLVGEPDAVPPESHLLGQLDRPGTGSYYLRPFGRPMIEAFLGGPLVGGAQLVVAPAVLS